MLTMIQKTNYGHPLSSILIRFLVGFLLVFCFVFLLSISFSIYTLLLITTLISLYVYFLMIRFKKNFEVKRKKLLEKMIELAKIKGNEHILDIGAGSGILAIGFAKNLTSGNVVGVDIYSIKESSLKTRIKNIIKINFIGNTIEDAQLNSKVEKVEKKCKFMQEDLSKSFKFSDETFDVIVSSQFLYCLSGEDRSSVLEEIDRVLKKDGKIIFFESMSFMNWDINDVKKIFEGKGYRIDIKTFKGFKKSCILYGKKHK